MHGEAQNKNDRAEKPAPIVNSKFDGVLPNLLPNILVICGPTASGKTGLALSIADQLPSEIISADSRQVYKFMAIGTGQPAEAEMRKVPHHFVSFIRPDEHFSAGDFGLRGRDVIGEILQRGKLPIVVGGTGLYIQALVDGLFSGPGLVKELRNTIEQRLAAEGEQVLWNELNRIDPEAAHRMLPSHGRRIVRALEVYYATGKPISEHHNNQKRIRRYNAKFFALDWKRQQLYERINSRVDGMISLGFLGEVKSLLAKGYNDRLKALQTVGYKEAFGFLRGEISYEKMIELIKQNTRRYAKRQLTWFRKEKRIHWVPINDERQLSPIASDILREL
jgi:tRNA dimethylallyltransferase